MGAESALSGTPSGIAVIGSSVSRPVTQVHYNDLHEQKKFIHFLHLLNSWIKSVMCHSAKVNVIH